MINKKEEWKQPGPGMQLIAILSSLKGWKGVLDEEIISKEKFNEEFENHMEQLFHLGDMLYNNKWKDCKND